jgi:isopropylmalate/homocitrate/citramalate synthase
MIVCDVGPRDGLQNEGRVLEPAVRAELVDRLAAAGVPKVEAVSAVNPARVPAMAGAEEVLERIERRPGTRIAALVLNEKGYERLAAHGVNDVHFAFASTEAFNRRNQNATPAESLAVAARIAARAHADGATFTLVVGATFGCPFEGAVDPAVPLAHAAAGARMGADAIVFADTTGVAVPTQVRGILERASGLGPELGVHLHNTRNTGYANAWAALEAGATVLDASVGGMGGCPFAPRATGNIATEDLVYLLHGAGVDTGIDLDAVVLVAEWLGGVVGRALPGQVHKAGVFAPVARGAAVA